MNKDDKEWQCGKRPQRVVHCVGLFGQRSHGLSVWPWLHGIGLGCFGWLAEEKTWQVLMSTASLCRPGSSRRAGSRKHGTSEFHGFGDVHASTSEGQPFRSAPTKPSKPTSKDMSKAMALVGSELLFVRREAFRSALLWTLRSRNCGKIRSSWIGLVTHH